jgi:hypothetical protein
MSVPDSIVEAAKRIVRSGLGQDQGGMSDAESEVYHTDPDEFGFGPLSTPFTVDADRLAKWVVSQQEASK